MTFFGTSASQAENSNTSPVTVVTQLSPPPSPTTTTTDATICCRQMVRNFSFLLFIITDQFYPVSEPLHPGFKPQNPFLTQPRPFPMPRQLAQLVPSTTSS